MMNALAFGAGRLVLLIVVAAVAASANAAAAGGPTPFQLLFDGHHVALSTSPNGFGHAGSFTASAPLCPAGNAADSRVTVGQEVSSTRVYKCDDGSGTFTVRVNNIPSEHVVAGTGTWLVMSGTGTYAKLRATGTWKTLTTHGDETNILGLTYTTRTQGSGYIDTVAPQLGFTRATVKKLASPGAYSVKVVFFARDSSTEGANYRLTARAGSRTLNSKSGQTSVGTTTTTLTARPPKGTKSLRLQLRATDPVGNASTITRSLTLPR